MVNKRSRSRSPVQTKTQTQSQSHSKRVKSSMVTTTIECPSGILEVINAIKEKYIEPLIDKHIRDTQLKVCPVGTEINDDILAGCADYAASRDHNLVSVVADLPLYYVAEKRDIAQNLSYNYSTTLDHHPHPTNQGNSGRCWMFAGLNSMRLNVIKQFKLPNDFELSPAYLFFYDKLERSNYVLEKMIELRQRSEKDQDVQIILQNDSSGAVSDGGTWDYFKNLVSKYGVMPRTQYDECFNTLNTETLNQTLNRLLAKFTAEIRTRKKQSDKKLRKLKDSKFLPEIYYLLTNFLGSPPTSFNWTFYDNNRKYHCINDLTPSIFFNEIIEPSFHIDDKIQIIHDPRKESKLYHTYVTENRSNMIGGQPDSCVTVTLDEMKESLIVSLQSKRSCWVACDVGKDYCFHRDLLSTEIYDVDKVLGTDTSLSKEDQLRYGVSYPSHAMLLVGVNIDDEGPSRWRIENSWGLSNGNDPGYLQMSDQWFDNYMYHAVVDRSCLPSHVLLEIEKHEKEPINLPHTDPFGRRVLFK